MRGKSLLCAVLVAGLALIVGCHHDKHGISQVKHPEDYVVPPNDSRFDEAPEEEYKRPPSKKKDAPGLNGGGPGSMMGGRR